VSVISRIPSPAVPRTPPPRPVARLFPGPGCASPLAAVVATTGAWSPIVANLSVAGCGGCGTWSRARQWVPWSPPSVRLLGRVSSIVVFCPCALLPFRIRRKKGFVAVCAPSGGSSDRVPVRWRSFPRPGRLWVWWLWELGCGIFLVIWGGVVGLAARAAASCLGPCAARLGKSGVGSWALRAPRRGGPSQLSSW